VDDGDIIRSRFRDMAALSPFVAARAMCSSDRSSRSMITPEIFAFFFGTTDSPFTTTGIISVRRISIGPDRRRPLRAKYIDPSSQCGRDAPYAQSLQQPLFVRAIISSLDVEADQAEHLLQPSRLVDMFLEQHLRLFSRSPFPRSEVVCRQEPELLHHTRNPFRYHRV
jgi:hypothetical protein